MSRAQASDAWEGRPEHELAWIPYHQHLLAEGKSADTVYNYRDTLQKISWHLPAGSDLYELTAADVTGWLAAGSGTWTQSSLASYSRRLRTWCLWAHRAGLAETNPMTSVRPVREAVAEIDIPDTDDIAAVAAAVSRGRDFAARRDWAIMCLLAEPGTPRATEVGDLPLAGLDLKHGTLRFWGKGNLERTISLGATSVRALILYLRARAAHPRVMAAEAAGKPLPWLFIGRQGKMTRHGVRQMLGRRCRQAGVPVIPPHHWRHLTAHVFMKAGGSVPDAMKLFGWRTPAMASRYGAAAASERAVQHARELSLGDAIIAGIIR